MPPMRRQREFAADKFSQLGHTDMVRRTVLTAAQILALNTTPVVIAPAPGAANVLSVLEILFKMIRTATAYANGAALEFRLTDAAGAKVTADQPAAIVTTGGAGTESSLLRGVAGPLTPVLNAPAVIRTATAFITGTGTAVVWVKYRIWTP